MKARYVGDTTGKDNITEVLFEYQKEDFTVKLARNIRNHVVETSRRKVPLNDWAIKVLKGYTRAIRCLYRLKDIDRGYMPEMARI